MILGRITFRSIMQGRISHYTNLLIHSICYANIGNTESNYGVRFMRINKCAPVRDTTLTQGSIKISF